MRAFLPSSGPRVAPTPTAAPIHYKIAENQRERAAAYRLCHEAYVRAGLMLPNRSQMRILPHHLLATSVVFIGVQDDEVISTVSLIGDGQLGLPMECAYGGEVAELRSPSRWLGEISSLASDPRQPRCQLDLLCNLTRLMAQYAQRHGLEHLLAAVHPKHARFYQRFLGFERLGDPKPYPAARHRPSVALVLDLPGLEQQQHASYLAYFAEPIPDEALRYRPMSGEERRLFARTALNNRLPPLAAEFGADIELQSQPLQRARA